MSVNISVNKDGVKDMQRLLKTMTRDMKQAFLRAVYDDGVEIFTKSQEMVPVDTGDLRSSARLTPPTIGNPTVTVSYDEEHSLIVHENVQKNTFRHDKHSHYLSRPYYEVVDNPAYELDLEQRIYENMAKRKGIKGLKGRKGTPGPLADKSRSKYNK